MATWRDEINYGGEGKLDAVALAALFLLATVLGTTAYYVPIHYNAILSFFALGLEPDASAVFVFSITFSSLCASLLGECEKTAVSIISQARQILAGFLASAICLPILFTVIALLFACARQYLTIVLAFLCVLLIASNKDKISASLVLFSSGALGLIVLFFGFCQNPLFALFTGFYAFQDRKTKIETQKPGVLLLLLAPLFGMLLVMLPAATPFLAQPIISAILPLSHAGGAAALVVSKALFDLCSAFAIGKPRSQGSAVLQAAGADMQSVFLGLCAGFLSLVLAIMLCIHAPRISRKLERRLIACCRVLLAVAVPALCGLEGILVCAAAFCIAKYAQGSGCSQGLCLGSLYLPSIAYPIGIVPAVARLCLGI